MSKTAYLCSAPICRGLEYSGDELSLYVIGAKDGTEISLGGAFASISDGEATLRGEKISNGIHTLFLHSGDKTHLLCKIEKTDRAFRRVYTDEDVTRVECACIELYQRLSALEDKVKRLEREAFESVLF